MHCACSLSFSLFLKPDVIHDANFVIIHLTKIQSSYLTCVYALLLFRTSLEHFTTLCA